MRYVLFILFLTIYRISVFFVSSACPVPLSCSTDPVPCAVCPQYGSTALMLAASKGRIDTVRYLVQQGADIKDKNKV